MFTGIIEELGQIKSIDNKNNFLEIEICSDCDPEDIDCNWFKSTDTVLVTAGASAPELVVERCIDYLRERFDATLQPRSIRNEEVHFPLPRELRSLNMQEMQTENSKAEK